MYDKSKYTGECQSCKKGKYTTEEFVALAIKVHGHRYDYSVTHYNTKRRPIQYICSIHGLRTQRPSEHLVGHGCRKCGDARRGELYVKDLEYRLTTIPASVTHVSHEGLRDSSQVVVNCEVHGDQQTTWSSLRVSKYGCKQCANIFGSRHSCHNREDRPALVYHVYFPHLRMWKLGVTIHTVEDRFPKYLEPQTLWVEHYQTEKEAYTRESELLAQYSSLRYRGSDRLIPGGSTELLYLPIKPTRASVGQPTVESCLNGETPTSIAEDNLPC